MSAVNEVIPQVSPNCNLFYRYKLISQQHLGQRIWLNVVGNYHLNNQETQQKAIDYFKTKILLSFEQKNTSYNNQSQFDVHLINIQKISMDIAALI